MSLYYELVYIYKYGGKSSFKHFYCFLKNSFFFGKVFTFVLDFPPKRLFKRVKNFLISSQKGVLFPNNFLKRGHILHARAHMF